MLNRRTILLALGAFALAALCVRLGFWQWHRMEDKQVEQARIERYLATPPADIASMAAAGSWNSGKHEWMRVRATGSFRVDLQVTVKFTTRDGQSGADVVTPLQLGNHGAILVNRGWMPTQNTNDRPANIPRPPAGRVTIEGWLRPDNHVDSNAVIPVDGQVRAVSAGRSASTWEWNCCQGSSICRSPQPLGSLRNHRRASATT